MKLNIASEKATNEGKVTKERNLIFNVLNVFTNQSTKSNRLLVPNGDLSRYFPCIKHWHFNPVLGDDDLLRLTESVESSR